MVYQMSPTRSRGYAKVLALATVLMFLLVGIPAVLMAEEPGTRGGTPDTDSEPNNTMGEATLIDKQSVLISGTVSLSDPDDFYRVVLSDDDIANTAQLLKINIMFDSWSSEPSAAILDQLGFILDTGTGTNITLKALTAPDLEGNFYIRVHAARGLSNYILDSAVSTQGYTHQDINNQPNSAQYIEPLNPQRVASNLSGDQEPSDYQDFYKLRVESLDKTRPGFVSVHMTAGDLAQFRVELYDTYLSLLAPTRELADPGLGANATVSYITAVSMDIFIRVWAANGTGTYNLTVYILTSIDLPDGDLAHSQAVELNGPDLHAASITDALASDTYDPKRSDMADYWSVDVQAGQLLELKVTSHHFNDETNLPRMVLQAFGPDGSPYPFDRPGEHIDRWVGGFAEMALYPSSEGTIFFGLALEDAASGGGGFTIALFTDSPPTVKEGAGPDRHVSITDDGPYGLVDISSLFQDREGDTLVYSYSIEDPYKTGLEEGLSVDIGDGGMVELRPWPRFEGHGKLILTATERDYGASTDTEFNITVTACGCHKVKVLAPYNGTLAFPNPIVLTYGVREKDTSIDLSKVFFDPQGHIIEFMIDGKDVVRTVSNVIEDTGLTNGTGPGSDAPLKGQHLDSAIVDGAVKIAFGRNPVTSGVPSTLVISLTDEARSTEVELESRITISAMPFDDRRIEASYPVELIIKAQRGPGSAPVWAMPSVLMASEDTPIAVHLDEHVRDQDRLDNGTLTYTGLSLGYNITISQQERDLFLLTPGRNWCGVEDLKFTATDIYGNSASVVVAVDFECVPDGPRLLIASPPNDAPVVVFEGEEVIMTALVQDVDTGSSALVYDWYINGYPIMAGGAQSYRFLPELGMAWASNVTVNVSVVVYNSVTGLSVSANWTVTVRHINQPPRAWIEGADLGKEGRERVLVGEELRLTGRGLDPEKAKLTYTWDFGDGTHIHGERVSHTYGRTGWYIATLIVSDGEYSTYAHINVSVEAQTTIVATPKSFNPAIGLWAGALVLLVALFGIGSTEPSKYKIFLLFTIFYTKLRGTEVLDHYLRGRIQGYITANPGAHYNMIKGDLQINNGNLAYHLKVLERQGYIKSVRDGIFKRFYPETMKVMKPPSLQERILVLLRSHPGLSQREIARMLDQSQSTVNDYVRRMSDAKLLRVERTGVTNHCFVVELD